MKNPGPSLESLTHRLADTPSEFLAEPRIQHVGTVHVAALVNDLLYRHGARAPLAALAPFKGNTVKLDRNRLALTMIAVWLLADEWFIAQKLAQRDVLDVLSVLLVELSAANAAHVYVHDPDRREEMVRVVLAQLQFRPADESIAQATDRLTSISGVQRKLLLEASRAAEKRAREIRAALEKKQAEESADKWSRE
jgi:hypothetical protein